MQALEGKIHTVRGHRTTGVETATETAYHLFVEDRQRCPLGAVIDDEPDRIRADIDHGDGALPLAAAIGS